MTGNGATVRLVATAGPHEGRGHVARALAVGEALAQLGARAELQLVRGGLTPIETRRASDLRIEILPEAPLASMGVTYVDLPDPNEAISHARSARLAVMDDRDAFSGRAPLVIQPAQARWTGPGRAERVLEGYGTVPIAAAYRRLRVSPRPAREPTDAIHVVACFGGGDPARVSERLVGSLAASGWPTDLIIGASYDGPTDGWPIEPIRDPDDLPERLAAADVVVLGAGTMKFEAACLGRPAILVAAADDQLRVGPPFAATGAAIYLGDGRTIPPTSVRAALEALLGDPAHRDAMGRRAAELIDGGGADRIAQALVDLADGADR